MSHINVYEIKSRFSYYARQVLKGKSFIIAYRNRPFAKFAPLDSPTVTDAIKFGVLKGKFKVPEDFNAPLDELENEFYA